MIKTEDIICRIKEIRRALDLSQDEFAEKLLLKRNSITLIETGKRNPSDRTLQDICREFNVNDVWLRTGQGEMLRSKSQAEEVADYVSELLEDDGTNPLYAAIKEIMKMYIELEPNSKELVNGMIVKLVDNLHAKKEG